MTLAHAKPSTDPREFQRANLSSPVIYAGRHGGGAVFTLANMRRFELSALDVIMVGMLVGRSGMKVRGPDWKPDHCVDCGVVHPLFQP
jgi:hypothetical protein